MTTRLTALSLLTLTLFSVEAVIARESALPHVVFIAGSESHGYGEHEANAGGEILVADLNRAGLVRATLHRNGWPAQGIDPEAAAIVLYMDGNESHEALQHLDELQELMRGGAGLVAIHYATHVPEPEGEAWLTPWLGGYYHSDISTNPHWRAEFAIHDTHPIGNGVSPFSATDEFYFNIKFSESMPTLPVLTAVPPDEAREHVPHPRRHFYLIGGTPPPSVVQNKGRRETIAWAVERADGGRGFAFTGGHYHWNWAARDYRRLVLNAISWTAKAQIPGAGIAAPCLSMEQLTLGLDSAQPRNFDKQAIIDTFGLQAELCE